MMMRGQISRGMSEPSCVHECSGMAATVGHSLRRPGSRTRTATAAPPRVRCLRPLASPYVEALETQRYDAGALGQFLFKGRYVVTARAAVARQSHDHQFGEVIERDRHDTVFGEVAVRGTARSPHVGRRGSPSNGTRTRRAMCLDSITPSPCQAHSRSTTSPRHPTCRSLQVLAWMFTASTGRSSVLACRRSRTRVAGRAGSRSEPASSGPRRSLKKPRPPACRASTSASLSRRSVG